jgi:hypothetical protein
MAIVRTSNNPADWIDIGRASGHAGNHARSTSSRFTPLTDVAPAFRSTGMSLTPTPRGPIVRKPSTAPRCGADMQGLAAGRFCGRREAHTGRHKSAEAVAVDNARRRSS